MTEPEPAIVPVNFTIAAAAKREFENLRVAYDNHQPSDPAAVLAVSWGIFQLDSGGRFENVVVSYYSQTQLAGVAHAVQEVSGVKLVFFTIPKYAAKFDGKVLDHSPERSFFLRSP